MNIIMRILAVSSVLFAAGLLNGAERPNIVYVLADDLGFGDLGCFGQATLKTPALDAMAREGMSFTRHFAGSTVCAPSRCVLLTGLHTGHCTVRGNGPAKLTDKDVCFPELLQAAGYRTGCFGKWGVGNPPPLDDPNRHGFHEFYGYVNMFHAHNYFPEFLIRNGKREPLRNELYPQWQTGVDPAREGMGVAELAVDYAPQLIVDDALEFIRKNHQRPFFVYLALNIPHANNEGGRAEEIGRNGMRVPDYGSAGAEDWPPPERGFARMIQQIDDDMARLFELLSELEIDDKTIVMFSSDNGPHQEGGHQVDFFDSNGVLRGKKRDLYDGGVRVPLIARWPGHVAPGSHCRQLCGFQDMFATVLELAQVDHSATTDGKSLAPLLTGASQQPVHAHLYWEFQEQGGKQAVYDGRWKAIRLNTQRPQQLKVELYDLEVDPSETRDVAQQHPQTLQRLLKIMDAEHTDPSS